MSFSSLPVVSLLIEQLAVFGDARAQYQSTVNAMATTIKMRCTCH
jgi:hypothetical protein